MKELNPAHIDAVVAMINRCGFFSLLSLEIKEIRYGYCRLEILLGEKHSNPFGGLHGGVYASAIDTAAYWAAYWSLPEETGSTSLDLHVDNLALAQGERLFVEGRQIKEGRTICLCEATVHDETGRLVACGSSKQVVVSGLQTIAQAAAAMGIEKLPPKFLDGSEEA